MAPFVPNFGTLLEEWVMLEVSRGPYEPSFEKKRISTAFSVAKCDFRDRSAGPSHRDNSQMVR